MEAATLTLRCIYLLSSARWSSGVTHLRATNASYGSPTFDEDLVLDVCLLAAGKTWDTSAPDRLPAGRQSLHEARGSDGHYQAGSIQVRPNVLYYHCLQYPNVIDGANFSGRPENRFTPGLICLARGPVIHHSIVIARSLFGS